VEVPHRAVLAAFSLAIALSVLAAPARSAGTEPPEEGITPSTAVARLKIARGTAWVRPADSGEWEEYSHNSPVVERSRVSIPRDSESEIQFRGSQYLLLEGGSEVDVRLLGEQKASFRLRSGQVAFSLSKEGFAPVTVKLPGNRDVSLEVPGLYWLSVDGDTTKLNVRRGEGAVSGEGAQPVTVKGGEEASIGKEVRVSKGGPPESRPGAAATELRGYGEWVWTSEYGYVWRPNVAEDWAPYYYGRWAWVYPYGWNWVGYEPWGWWPYHYGWWVSVASWGWVWAPCNSFYSGGYYYHGYPYAYRYGHYNPANVRFVNDGRYVRWVPEQPGRTPTRTPAFSRTDTRLARWDQPMPGGTVSSRGSGGRLPAASGRGAVPSSARGGTGGAGRETAVRSAGQAMARPFPGGGGRVSAVPSGSGTPGRSAGGGRALSRYSAPGGPGRAPAIQGGTWYGGGGEPRSAGRGYAYPSTRGYGGYGSAPRGSLDAGYGAPRGAARPFGGGGSVGYSGSARGFGGDWGGGWGGGGRGGGFSGGAGGRTR
jgi:hypothetical protein